MNMFTDLMGQCVKSTHRAEVVPVFLEPHPNADTLSIVRVWGYTVVVKTADWKHEPFGVYVVPDSVVPDHPYFQFLAAGAPEVDGGSPVLRLKDRRITARRFRGVMSEGFLISRTECEKHWPGPFTNGDDLAERIGITRYEAPTNADTNTYGHGRGLMHMENEPGPPSNIAPIYDLESWHRYGAETFKDGDYVVLTEKIDGTNFRACYYFDTDQTFAHDGLELFDERYAKFYVGSHRTWKRQMLPVPPRKWWIHVLEFLGIRQVPLPRAAQDVYSRAARMYPQIEHFCRANPNHTLYGEIYGCVLNGSGAKYGHAPEQFSFAAFDIRKPNGEWMDYSEFVTFCKVWRIPVVPPIVSVFYTEELVRACMSGPSLTANLPVGEKDSHLREGVVIRLLKEEHPSRGTRKCLKAVSPEFLEKADKK